MKLLKLYEQYTDSEKVNKQVPAHETAHLIGKEHLKNDERTDEEKKRENAAENLLNEKALGGTSLSEKQKNDIINLILRRKKVGNGNPMIIEDNHTGCNHDE